ncbi:MAG: RAMP superfamily CRISPR-associated protein [Myxococcota bacterium]
MTRFVRFDVLTWWHAGTGRGDGAALDAVVHRTAEGLPFLPGRTVKGLLRDAFQLAEHCQRVAAGRTNRWFGTPPPPTDADDREQKLEESRFDSVPGALTFSNAELGDAVTGPQWRRWAALHRKERSALFDALAATRIDANGVCMDHTLRTIEVAVPMALRGRIDGPDDPEWVTDLGTALPLIRNLGTGRTRGLGRVLATLEDR